MHPVRNWFHSFAPLCCAGLLFVGCAGTDLSPISRNIANVELMIDHAREDKADTYAPMELRMAEEELENARAALKEEDADLAGRKTEIAMEHARLARTKARAEKAKADASDKAKDLDTLKEEVKRKE